MSKKNSQKNDKSPNKQRANRRDEDFTPPPKVEVLKYPLPDVVNMDDLAVMSDEALSEAFRYVADNRTEASKVVRDLRPWDTELEYIKREQGIRRGRREAQRAYEDEERRLDEHEAYVDRNSPPADYDNYDFVRLHKFLIH